MKKLFLLFSFFAVFYFSINMIAQAATPSPTKTVSPTEAQDERIKNIIEKVASKAAKMDLVETKGVLGTVTDISDTQITLSDLYNNTRFIDVDELTKFSSPSAKGSFGISDIQKGSSLGVLGRYNKQSRRILARFVEVTSLAKTVHAQVLSIDEENFRILAVTNKREKIMVDIERITKTSSFSKESGLTKSGFSKISVNERFIATGYDDLNEKNVLIAGRIILFPELPSYPNINIDLEIVPSTGSGKKLTPIIKK